MIYLARRWFHMSAREALVDTPAWEMDLLIEQWNEEQEAARDAGR